MYKISSVYNMNWIDFILITFGVKELMQISDVIKFWKQIKGHFQGK